MKDTGAPPHQIDVGYRWHLVVGVVAAALVALAFANALAGDFVYDDRSQIVNNPLIQTAGRFWQAVASDVWGFKTNVGGNASNYYRPLFIAWLSLNYQLFGLQAVGWHALNIGAHLLATLLGYAVLVRLRFPPTVCALVTWLFAVHPTHTQSVTWISGVPDVLMTIFLFSSFLFYEGLRRKPQPMYWAGALVFYAAALLSKEPAVIFPAILLLSEWIMSRQKGQDFNLLKALRWVLPFAVLGIAFVVARYQVLGVMRSLAPGAPGTSVALMTVPSILWFYIKQMICPWPLSLIHDLSYVTGANAGFTNLVLPLVLLVVIGWMVYLLIRRDVISAFGLIWFLLPLVPVLDPRVFVPELQVQDRYLYLPLWGGLICLYQGLMIGVDHLWARHSSQRFIIYALGIVLAVLLGLSTRQYNQVWRSDLSLWEHTVRTAPASSIAWSQLGNEYQRANRLAEAKNALTRAINLRPDLTAAHISMGIIANREGHYDEAERWLTPVVASFPDLDVALEQLALTYQQQGRITEALKLFEQGRQQLPLQRDRYTVNIAVLLALSGRKDQARLELESLAPRLAASTNYDVLRAWWFLGELYREQGRLEQARQAYRQYLNATNSTNDPNAQRLRQLVVQALQQ